MDLSNYVEQVNILNIDHNASTLPPSEFIINSNFNKFIVSDKDEEMLILIKFRDIVSLKSMTIYAKANSYNHDTANRTWRL